MRRIGILLFCWIVVAYNANSQGTIDHWESLVNADNTWKYFPGTIEPASSWIDLSFNDDTWSQGPGGFGYGDDDDGTVI